MLRPRRLVRRLAPEPGQYPAAALLVLVLFGCAEEPPWPRTELFAEPCAALLGCNCDVPQFADIDQCARVYSVQYAYMEGIAEVLELEVDAACIVGRLPISRHHCATGPEVYVAPDPECGVCNPIHGTAALGAACTAYDGFSDCNQGLRCIAQRCVDPCEPGDAPIPCEPDQSCLTGFYCDSNTELCLRTPQIGDPCPPECAKGLVCEYWRDPSVCGPLPGEGDRCSGECQGDLGCVEGTCEARPMAGEPCRFNSCDKAAQCDMQSQICEADAAPGEACGIGTSCMAGAHCDYEMSICKADRQAQEPCGGYDHCADGLRCRGEPKVCIPLEAYVCER